MYINNSSLWVKLYHCLLFQTIGTVNNIVCYFRRYIVQYIQKGYNMISYEKLFTILQEKGLNKNWLRNNGFPASTVDYLIKNKDVRISTINKLCNILDCKPEDIMTYTPDEN